MLDLKKKVYIVFLLIITICCLSINVFADDSSEVTKMQSVKNTTNNTTNNTINNTTNNAVNNNITELAKTGESSTIIILVTIFAISSIFAYKKIRDFNA